MSIYSLSNAHKNALNAEKIAELINQSDDIEFKKILFQTLKKYAENSQGLFDDKNLCSVFIL
jgi:hypothetical protein